VTLWLGNRNFRDIDLEKEKYDQFSEKHCILERKSLLLGMFTYVSEARTAFIFRMARKPKKKLVRIKLLAGGFLFGSLFDPEDGSNMFLRKLSEFYGAMYPPKVWYSS
jgi:hypothetical protein